MAINLQSSQLVAVFDGQNYEFWSAIMKTTLMNKDLWDVVKNGILEAEAEPATPGAEKEKDTTKWKALKIKDTAALQLIQHAVADIVFDKILSATSAHEACKLLEHSYQGNEKVKTVKLQSLRREFENLKMKEGEKVKAYSDRIQAIANQMRALGEGKSNFDLVVKMLASMPKSYASMSSLMEETKDLKAVTYAELIGSLEAHEKKFFPEEEEDSEGAFHARFKNLSTGNNGNSVQGQSSYRKRWWCDYCKRDNHSEERCFEKHSHLRICRACGNSGHFARDCKAKKSEQAHVTQEDDGEEDYHMFSARQKDQESNGETSWLIDSGCTNHMTANERLFINLDTSFNVPILVGNGAVLRTKGKGDIEVETKKGKRVIRNVLLLPNITKNLLSVPQMIEQGYEVTFMKRRCIIRDQAGREIADVEMIKNSFHLQLSSSNEAVMVAISEDSESGNQKCEKCKCIIPRDLLPYKKRLTTTRRFKSEADSHSPNQKKWIEVDSKKQRKNSPEEVKKIHQKAMERSIQESKQKEDKCQYTIVTDKREVVNQKN